MHRNGLSVAALSLFLAGTSLQTVLAQRLQPIAAREPISASDENVGDCFGQVDPRLVEAELKALTSNTFFAREKAMQSLLEIGEPALPQLNAYKSEALEVQRRVDRIVQRLEAQRFERISRQFMLSTNADEAAPTCGLPAWKCYCKFVGASRTSKLLYLEMIRQQPEFAQSIDRTFCQQELKARPDALPKLVAETSALSSRLHNDRLVRMLVPEIGDIVAVLLATSLLEETAPVEVNELLATSVHSVPVSTYVHRRGYRDVLHKLYSLWIPKTHQSMAAEALLIALRDGHSTGVEIARKYLDDHFDSGLRESAIQCLARFGDTTDLQRLLPLLDDHTVCSEFLAGTMGFSGNGIQESIESPPNAASDQDDRDDAPIMLYRISDLALASSMLIEGYEMAEAFPGFAKDNMFAYDVRSIAVAKTSEGLVARDEQIERWKEHLDSLLGNSPAK